MLFCGIIFRIIIPCTERGKTQSPTVFLSMLGYLFYSFSDELSSCLLARFSRSQLTIYVYYVLSLSHTHNHTYMPIYVIFLTSGILFLSFLYIYPFSPSMFPLCLNHLLFFSLLLWIYIYNMYACIFHSDSLSCTLAHVWSHIYLFVPSLIFICALLYAISITLTFALILPINLLMLYTIFIS